MPSPLAKLARKAADLVAAVTAVLAPLAAVVVVGRIFLDSPPITPPANEAATQVVAIIAAAVALAAVDSFTAPAFATLRDKLAGRRYAPCPACEVLHEIPADVLTEHDGRTGQ